MKVLVVLLVISFFALAQQPKLCPDNTTAVKRDEIAGTKCSKFASVDACCDKETVSRLEAITENYRTCGQTFSQGMYITKYSLMNA